MSRKRALFICGSINQTTQMHQIARELPEVDAAFTPYYGDLDFEIMRRLGMLESTIGGNKLRGRKPPRYGLVGVEFPEAYLRQILHAFRPAARPSEEPAGSTHPAS